MDRISPAPTPTYPKIKQNWPTTTHSIETMVSDMKSARRDVANGTSNSLIQASFANRLSKKLGCLGKIAPTNQAPRRRLGAFSKENNMYPSESEFRAEQAFPNNLTTPEITLKK